MLRLLSRSLPSLSRSLRLLPHSSHLVAAFALPLHAVPAPRKAAAAGANKKKRKGDTDGDGGAEEEAGGARVGGAAAGGAAAPSASSLAAGGLGADPSLLDVGDCIVHRRFHYRGVVVGVDRECKQSEAWRRANGIDALSRGASQPFYHILPDTRDRPGSPILYAAHENVRSAIAARSCRQPGGLCGSGRTPPAAVCVASAASAALAGLPLPQLA